MSPILSVCCEVGCNRLISPPFPHKGGKRCPEHRQLHDARRYQTKRARGMFTRHWQRVRQQVLNRDRHTCRRCGQLGNSVHLRPELHGDHRQATPEDCVTLCVSCHAAESQRRDPWWPKPDPLTPSKVPDLATRRPAASRLRRKPRETPTEQ